MSEYQDRPENYRVAEIGGEYQPEMVYQCRAEERWVALNREGYWVQPDDYSSEIGTPLGISPMSREDAERAVWRAQKINHDIPSYSPAGADDGIA